MEPPSLPDYIKNNRYIIALEKDENTVKRYNNHLCFFRCLAIAKFGKTHHNCNLKAKELFQVYCKHFQVNPQDFKGVELTDFPQLETFYETQLFAMFLKQDGSAKTLYLSQASFPTKIYLNVFENHLSLITESKRYSKQFICNRCDKLFVEMRNLKQHESKCDGTVKYVFLVVYIKINYLCLRNWRKWAYWYGRRISTKSGLPAMILKHISGTFVKA